MKWILLITVVVNGQAMHPDKVKFETKEACMRVLNQVTQHEMFKAYQGKATCEKL